MTKKYTDVENPNNNKKECSKYWIIPVIICLFILIGTIILIIYKIVNYFENTEKEREVIDKRNTYISYNTIDYVIEPNIHYNCSNSHQCIFNCSYVKNNLNEEKKACEYDDWYDFWRLFLIIWLSLILLSCLCNIFNSFNK
jgi:hypothetical protein